MRTRAHSFCLWGLSLAAASWWLTFMTPWSGGLRLGAVLLAVAVWLAWIGWRLRRSSGGQTEREPVLPGLLELPQGWRGDRVTVVELESRRGAYVAAEDGVLRVMVPTPALLERVMSELVAWRRGVPPNALALRVEAAAECGESAWLGRLQAWRQAIADAEARLGCRLPLYLLVRFPAPRRCAGINGTLGVVLKGAPCSSLRQWRERLDEWRKQLELQAPGLGDGEGRARFDLRQRAGAVGAGWLLRRCLPCCKAPRRCPPRLARHRPAAGAGRRCCAVAVGRARQALSGLAVRPLSAGGGEEGGPGSWLFGLERGPRLSAGWKLVLNLWLLACLTAMAALAASAWSNRQLLERLAADVARYRSLPAERDAERGQALLVLERDARELQSHADLGVPLRLGFGFIGRGPGISASPG